MTGVEIVPRGLGPGLVKPGFAEMTLERAREIEDPTILWAGATDAAGLAQKWNGFPKEKAEIKTAQMFIEIELGQRLGPPPGWGNQHEQVDIGLDIQATLNVIPQPRVSELRRFYGHRDLLIDKVREGKRARMALLLAVDEAEAKDQPDLSEIRTGDFRDVLADIEPGTVALVLTDPPYPTEYLPLWSDLGKHATRWLPEGGSLVAYCGQSILPDALDRLGEHLRYWWTLSLNHSTGAQNLPGKFVKVGWKPVLWFVNERRCNSAYVADRIAGSPPRKTMPTGDDGSWAQGVEEVKPIISALTQPGDIIIDPFAGSGSFGTAATRFGRRFIGATL